MLKREFLIVFFIFALITSFFFHKVFISGFVPFPGDLLTVEYKPWNTYSYIGYEPGAYPSKAQYFDVVRQLYPWKTVVIEQLKHGQIPLWNPYNFSGSPLLANFQSAVFYPLNILYFLFSQIDAWTILIILQPFLAGIFTYFYAQKIRLSKIASIFTGVSYAFSSFAIVWLEYNTIGHAILWLPLALLAIENLLKEKTLRFGFLLVFSIVASLFAGHVQVFAYLLTFVTFFIIFRLINERAKLGKEGLFFLFLILGSLGIGGVQLVPGIELVNLSARVSHSYEILIQKILIQPWQLVMLFVPDFFGNPATRNYWPLDTYIGKVLSIGFIPLIFTVYSIFSKKNAVIKYYSVSAFVVFLFITVNPFSLLIYKIAPAFITASSPTLATFIFCFSIAILSGFGIDAWQKDKLNRRKLFGPIFLFSLLFFVLWAIVLFPSIFSKELLEHITIARRNLFYVSAIALFGLTLFIFGLVRSSLRYYILIFLLFVHLFDLWRSFDKFNPFVPKDLVFPSAGILTFLQKDSGIDRFWGYGVAAIEANFATQYNIFSPDGYDPLYPKTYGEFIQSSTDGKIHTVFSQKTRSDAAIVSGFGEEDMVKNLDRLKVMDALGVKYVLDRFENKSTEKTFPESRFALVFEDSGWKVYENKEAAPRAFLTTDYRVYKNKDEFSEMFFAEDFNPTKTILLEENVNGLQKADELGSSKIVSYEPNRVHVNTNANQAALLFLSDTYFPGWQASVDGKDTKIYRANYAFRAVVVPKGKHTVVFRYKPNSYTIGMIITGLSLFLAGFGAAFMKKRS